MGVVSGRPLGFLLTTLGDLQGLELFGLYGLERSAASGTSGRRKRVVNEAALAWQGAIGAAAAAAEREAPQGVEVERKGLSFTLHFRRHPELAAWAFKWADAIAADYGLAAQPGRLSVELLPPVAVDKGTVVDDLSRSLSALCYIGDDRGDLPAFAALGRQRAAGKVTVAVGVAGAEQPSELPQVVDFLVDGPVGVVALLEGLAGGLRSGSH